MRFTVNPADFSRTDPDEIVRLILESDQLRGGSIIDLHDGAAMKDDAARGVGNRAVDQRTVLRGHRPGAVVCGGQAAMVRTPYFGMFRSRVTRMRPSAWDCATRKRSNGSRWCIGSTAACSAWW